MQCGFRRKRGTQDQISIIRQISEKAISELSDMYMHVLLIWKRLSTELTDIVRSLYSNKKNIVRVRNESSNTFNITPGLREGMYVSILSFNLILDQTVKEFKKKAKHNADYWKMEAIKTGMLCRRYDYIRWEWKKITIQPRSTKWTVNKI